MMHESFDVVARSTVERLEKEFGKKVRKTYPRNISPKSIGIEIEIKFKYLFPDLHEKYFSDSTKKYYTRSIEEKQKITEEINVAEKDILKLFEKTVECGVPKGLDRYWEFALNPVYDTNLILYQIDILEQVELIPKGYHSLHINIGDVALNKKAYIVTGALQLLYVRKERIIEGVGDCLNPVTWSKKGRAGIRKKTVFQLVNSDEGYEIRLLEYMDLETLDKIFRFLTYYLEESNSEYEKLEKYMSDLLIKYNLPDKNWENPTTNPMIWTKYVEKFEDMSREIKENEYFKKFI